MPPSAPTVVNPSVTKVLRWPLVIVKDVRYLCVLRGQRVLIGLNEKVMRDIILHFNLSTKKLALTVNADMTPQK